MISNHSTQDRKSHGKKLVTDELLRRERKIECDSKHSEKFTAEMFNQANEGQGLGDNQNEKHEEKLKQNLERCKIFRRHMLVQRNSKETSTKT